MFGIGMTEMLVIAVIALIFIGPDQIPEVARTVGRFLNDLRRSTDDIKRQFTEHSGLPTNLNNLDQWTRPSAQSNRAPGELPPPPLGVGNPPDSTGLEVSDEDNSGGGHHNDNLNFNHGHHETHFEHHNDDVGDDSAKHDVVNVKAEGSPVSSDHTFHAPVGARPAVKKTSDGSDQT